MRLLSFSVDGEWSYGLVADDGQGVVDLQPRIPGAPDLLSLVRSERVAEAAAFVDDEADWPLDQVRHERLLDRPEKILCIGVNYGGRADEYRDATTASYPSIFVRFPASLTGHGQALVRPPESPQFDYEGEIVAVVGRAGRRIPVDQARDHLLGLTLGNDGTIRDWVRHAKFNVTQGKNWECSGSIGPELITMDEIGSLGELELTTKVNGEIRQHDTTGNMAYPIEYLVHYVSTFITLNPGDVIFTGTPTGAGARFDPPRWLLPGDVVEVSVPELGTLRNTVEDEPQ